MFAYSRLGLLLTFCYPKATPAEMATMERPDGLDLRAFTALQAQHHWFLVLRANQAQQVIVSSLLAILCRDDVCEIIPRSSILAASDSVQVV